MIEKLAGSMLYIMELVLGKMGQICVTNIYVIKM